MNRPLRHIAVFCGVLVLALLVRATWVQFVQADALANDDNNRRVKIEAFSYPRGNIIVGGKPITGSVETAGDFKYKRVYKDGPMYAPITGYASQSQGTTFLEGVYKDILSGKDDRLFLKRAKDVLTGEKPRGGDVLTTINEKAQRTAYKALTDLNAKGAVVALEPATGKILAMASTPSYDPSVFAGSSFKEGDKYTSLIKDKSKPMNNRASLEIYPPGSTFKILTAAAALEHGIVPDIDTPVQAPVPYTLPQTATKVGNDITTAPCANASLKVGMQWSCNNTYLEAANRLGTDKMRETAEKFGFNQKIFTPVRTATSGYPKKLDKPQTALTGMGQGSLTSTPLQMAMVVAGLANNGKVMQPYMVEETRGPDLSTIEKFEPKELSQAVSESTAKKVQEMMENTAENGTAKKALIDGVKVGAKTGTAQHGANVRDERPYAWFVSYAKQGNGSPVAVAVFVDPSDMDIPRKEIAGGKLGGPIAKKVMEAVLGK
ncbi:penicillin-binding protein [Streptomyces sp. NRRL F-5755]|uniref:peptidoglycan D,D-transpeptidase FtsI family protein n=1 Tax=Streptomyces sp. NRRL F-5755 TaxID=1519475 RepID=UPI0006AFAD65|nr:penicillin-binding protein 2 [Streptomyces sp. NRRL F-5755]KOT87806.1 penicillin-binding protein [Streptomyces sp. NRRL F-5755]KWT62420.1 penicillin-binding protein [Streptomyces albus subsp. albus]